MNRADGERESTSHAGMSDTADDAPVEYDVVEIVAVDTGDDDDDEVAESGGMGAETATGDTTDAIRQDIEQTRAQMSGTIDEITERLNPKRLMDEAKETVRDATVGKVTGMMNNASRSAGGVVDRIKENPVTAAMIGAGAWWLLTRLPESGRSSSSYVRNYGNFSSTGRSGGESYDRSASGGYGDAASSSDGESTSSGYGGDRRWSSSRIGEGGGISRMARTATETVSDYTSRGREQFSEIADETGRTFNRWMRDNPLAVGAAAIAIGAAIGAAIPETQRERELIGETRDRLMDKAQEMASHTVEQVASVMPGSGGESGRSGKGGSGTEGSASAGKTGDTSSGDRGGVTPGNS